MARSPAPAEVGGCLTGYFGNAGQVEAAAGLLARLKASGPAPLVVLCDPVVGDGGRFYVHEETRDAVRRLAQAADILTPNSFELAFLAESATLQHDRQRRSHRCGTGAGPAGSGGDLGLRRRGRDGEPSGHAATARSWSSIAPSETAPHGTGDLLAALYFGHRLGGAEPRDALVRATSAVLRLVELAGDAAELPLAAGQDAFLAAPEGVRVAAVDDG